MRFVAISIMLAIVAQCCYNVATMLLLSDTKEHLMANMESMIRCRIDKQTLDNVTPVLEGMGLNVSSAIRLFLKRIEQTSEFPFDLGQQNSSQSQVVGIAAALEFLRFQEQGQSQGIASLQGSPTNANAQLLEDIRAALNAPDAKRKAKT
jgi:DNA-damage-inducible protein J